MIDAATVVLAVVTLIVAVLLVATRGGSNARRTALFRPEDLIRPANPQYAGSLHKGLDRVAVRQISALVAAGNRAAAEKLYRERTGSLRSDAKSAVDRWQATLPPSKPTGPAAPVGMSLKKPSTKVALLQLDTEVRTAVRTRGKLSAVKLVRDRTGLGLREAKQYVDRLS